MKFRAWLARLRNGNRIQEKKNTIETPSASASFSIWSLQHSNATTTSFPSSSATDRRDSTVDNEEEMDRFPKPIQRQIPDGTVDEEEEVLRNQIEEIAAWEREEARFGDGWKDRGKDEYRGGRGYGDPYAPRRQYFPSYGYDSDDDSDLYSQPPRHVPPPPPVLRASSPPLDLYSQPPRHAHSSPPFLRVPSPPLLAPPPPPSHEPPPSPHPRITPARRNLPEACFSCIETIEPGSYVYRAGQKCSHAFCKSCLTEFVTAAVEGDGTFPPRCCKGPIDKEVVRRALDPEAWGRWKVKEEQGSSNGMFFSM